MKCGRKLSEGENKYKREYMNYGINTNFNKRDLQRTECNGKIKQALTKINTNVPRISQYNDQHAILATCSKVLPDKKHNERLFAKTDRRQKVNHTLGSCIQLSQQVENKPECTLVRKPNLFASFRRKIRHFTCIIGRAESPVEHRKPFNSFSQTYAKPDYWADSWSVAEKSSKSKNRHVQKRPFSCIVLPSTPVIDTLTKMTDCKTKEHGRSTYNCEYASEMPCSTTSLSAFSNYDSLNNEENRVRDNSCVLFSIHSDVMHDVGEMCIFRPILYPSVVSSHHYQRHNQSKCSANDEHDLTTNDESTCRAKNVDCNYIWNKTIGGTENNYDLSNYFPPILAFSRTATSTQTCCLLCKLQQHQHHMNRRRPLSEYRITSCFMPNCKVPNRLESHMSNSLKDININCLPEFMPNVSEICLDYPDSRIVQYNGIEPFLFANQSANNLEDDDICAIKSKMSEASSTSQNVDLSAGNVLRTLENCSNITHSSFQSGIYYGIKQHSSTLSEVSVSRKAYQSTADERPASINANLPRSRTYGPDVHHMCITY